MTQSVIAGSEPVPRPASARSAVPGCHRRTCRPCTAGTGCSTPAPAARVVHGGLRTADQRRDRGRRRASQSAGSPAHVGELAEVAAGAVDAALGGAAVVGGEDDDGVVELAESLERVDSRPTLRVDRLRPPPRRPPCSGRTGAAVGAQSVPGGHVQTGLGVAGGSAVPAPNRSRARSAAGTARARMSVPARVVRPRRTSAMSSAWPGSGRARRGGRSRAGTACRASAGPQGLDHLDRPGRSARRSGSSRRRTPRPGTGSCPRPAGAGRAGW